MSQVKKSLPDRLEETKQALSKKFGAFPRYVVVLGSGLAGLLEDMEVEADIPYGEIPNLPMATVEGHPGRLVVGKLNGVRVACMQGRFHFYEGHSMQDVVFPYRAFASSGAKVFLLTNAAGGLHPEMSPMDFVLIRDHINLMGTNPLIGPNEPTLGTRFPDMTNLYDPELRRLVSETANGLGIKLRTGVYVALHGPSYETPAEIKMYRALGGDVVGMSTVPEAIAIHHMGRKVIAISCITNLAAGVTTAALVHSEVLDNAKGAYVGFSRLIKECLAKLEKRA